MAKRREAFAHRVRQITLEYAGFALTFLNASQKVSRRLRQAVAYTSKYVPKLAASHFISRAFLREILYEQIVVLIIPGMKFRVHVLYTRGHKHSAETILGEEQFRQIAY